MDPLEGHQPSPPNSNQSSSTVTDTQPKNFTQRSGAIFLILHGLIAVVVVPLGLYGTVLGTLFFDDPNASYSVFLAKYLVVPLLIGILFLASLFLRINRRYGLSMVISAFVSIVCILSFLVWFMPRYLQNSQQKSLMDTPTLTHFVCEKDLGGSIDIQNDGTVTQDTGLKSTTDGKTFTSVVKTLGSIQGDGTFVGQAYSHYARMLVTCANSTSKKFFEIYKDVTSSTTPK